MTEAQRYAKLIDHWYDNPVDFAYEAVQIDKLDQWQEESLQALSDNDLVAIAAGTGVGKEVVASISTLWYLMTRPMSRVVATSASATQVQNALWTEINLWLHKGDFLRQHLEWTPSRVFHKGKDKAPVWYAYHSVAAKRISSATGEKEAEGGAGMHRDYMLLVISEASGVEDVHWDARMLTMTSNIENKCLAIGNPVRRSGRFYEVWAKPKVRRSWYVKNVSHMESTFTSKEMSQRMIDTMGNDHPVVQAKVHGQFPTFIAGKTVFGFDEISDCFKRKVDDDLTTQLQIGVDVARFGTNKTVIYSRRGPMGLGFVEYEKTDVVETCEYAAMEAQRWWRRATSYPRKYSEVLPVEQLLMCQREVLFCVDETGVGGGVVDLLRRQGWRAVGVNNGSVPRNKRHYVSRGDEMWMVDGKQAFKEAYLPEDEDLQNQLCNREIMYDSKGLRRKLETKDQMQKRGLSSPDIADACMLAFVTVRLPSANDYRNAMVMG